VDDFTKHPGLLVHVPGWDLLKLVKHLHTWQLYT